MLKRITGTDWSAGIIGGVSWWLLIGLALPIGAQSPQAASSSDTKSRSSVTDLPEAEWGEDRQIRVFAENPLARVMFDSFANELRDDFREEVLRYRPESKIDRDSWAIPIAVELWGDTVDVFLGDDVRTAIEIRPDNRLRINVSVKLHDGFEEKSVRIELLRSLILDHILAPYASHPEVIENRAMIAPEWMVHGFDQLIEHKRGGRPSAFYEGVVKSGQMLKPDTLFSLTDPEELDPVSYTIFRTSAAAMVGALLDQPNGDLGLRNLLADLGAAGQSAMAPLLRQHFPAFREIEQGLEKWWVLQIATLGQHQSFEFMSREKTEQWLSEALMVRFEAEETEDVEESKAKGGLFKLFRKAPTAPELVGAFEGSIDQYSEFIGRPGTEERLIQCLRQLQVLKRSGFPLYRPLFDRYEIVIERLGRRKFDGADSELAALAEMRGQIRNTLIQAEDYLNYFEATQAPRRSEAFDDYLKLRKELESNPMPRRHDRISQYLDALELEFR